MVVTIFFGPFSVLQSFPTRMELDASSRPRGPLTDAKKQFRTQRGLCNDCVSHVFGTACPKIAQHDAIQAARSAVKFHEISIFLTPAASTEESKNS